MSRTRFDERKREMRAAVARLSEAAAAPASDLVRDASIQRFEFSFEIVWKTLKLYLEHQGHECVSPRATIKKAFSEGIIVTESEADSWMGMLEDRNLTSHAYDESLAKRIYQSVVRDYVSLLASMATRIDGLVWD
jgi:nucleotidyltransferase substrate binding protein (TIGR01987 family)